MPETTMVLVQPKCTGSKSLGGCPGAKRGRFSPPKEARAESPPARHKRAKARSHSTTSPAASHYTHMRGLCASWGAEVTRTTARLCGL